MEHVLGVTPRPGSCVQVGMRAEHWRNQVGRPKDPFEKELEDSVKRLVGAVGRGLADTVERSVESARERHEAERRAREEKLRARQERRRRRRAEKYQERTAVEGWVLALVGIVLFAMGLFIQPEHWWLVFPGFFLGLRGARILGHKREEKQANTPPPLPLDPREARLDRTCEGLLTAFRESPDHVKAFFGKPEQTVETLRASAKDLLRRERQLRALVSPDEEGRLAGERDRLTNRIAAASDPVARERFAAALAAVEQQIAQRREIARNADRLEAEHTRLVATLEGLHVNVVRLRSADAFSADVAGQGLRRSLDELRAEVSALADAAEEVNRIEAFAVGPEEFGETGRGRGSREKV